MQKCEQSTKAAAAYANKTILQLGEHKCEAMFGLVAVVTTACLVVAGILTEATGQAPSARVGLFACTGLAADSDNSTQSLQLVPAGPGHQGQQYIRHHTASQLD